MVTDLELLPDLSAAYCLSDEDKLAFTRDGHVALRAVLSGEEVAAYRLEIREATFEKKRLAEQTKADIERMGQQHDSELSRLSKQSYAELRRFSAQESIRLAEEKLRAQIDGTADARLVKASISEIGGLN